MHNNEPDKVLEKRNIAIYELNQSSNHNEFRVIYFVNSKPESFRRQIVNPDNLKRWVSSIKSAVNFKNFTDTVQYTHVVVGVRSIFKKEAIVKTMYNVSEDRQKISVIQKIDTTLRFNYQYDKLSVFKITWDIHALEPGTTRVEMNFKGQKKEYPYLIEQLLKEIFINKLYKIARKSKKQAAETAI
jgi:hypothetical protein